MDDYDEKDGQRVWLAQDEIDLLISKAKDTTQKAAITLGARCGLRREEIASVTVNDFTQAPDGWLRVWGDYTKRDKYREVPVPDTLEARVDGIADEREPDEPVVNVHPGSVYRWVRRAAERCQAETSDPGWQYLKPHDLRRTWGGHLLWDCGILPAVVMTWGGWDDWKTFREHYLGEMSPAAADRERSKIDYISGREADAEPVFQPTVGTGRSNVFG